MRSIDLAAELASPVYVLWGGREGSEVGAAKPTLDALDRYRRLRTSCDYVRDQGYEIRSAIEPKPVPEPRRDILLIHGSSRTRVH